MLLVILGGLRLLFPGDVPFIADEPLIVDRALDALESGTVVTSGLQGTRGAAYGPAPTWFYQAALLTTSDLRVVAMVKIVLATLLTGTALVILGRSVAGLSVPLGAFAFVSPYLWFYSRDLWDNSFAIPFSAMLLATYAAFHASSRTRWLVGTGLFGVLCLLTHFMTVPLVGAVFLHLAMSQRRRLVSDGRFAAGVAAIGAGCVLVLFPYMRGVSVGSAGSFLWSPSPRSLVFAMDGFRIFTLRGFDYVIGAWGAAGTAPVLILISCLGYGVGIYGLYLMNRVLRVNGARRDGDPSSGPGSEPFASTREVRDASSAVAGVVALTLVLFVLLANGKRLVEHPHYYSGVWIAFFLLWWWGMSDLLTRVWARRAFFVQAGTMGVFLVGLVVWLHQNRGTRSLHYGPTLGNQMEVAEELDRLRAPDAPPSAAHHPRLFPQAIRVLRRLDTREDGDVGVLSGRFGEAPGGEPSPGASSIAGAPQGGVEIVYTHPAGRGGEIMVRLRPEG